MEAIDKIEKISEETTRNEMALQSSATSIESLSVESLKEKITEILKTIYDPEIPVNIYDLGLIYGLEVNEEGEVRIKMTLTSPACPVAETFPQTVQDRIVLSLPNVTLVAVELVWDPPWTRDCMSELAKLELNMF